MPWKKQWRPFKPARDFVASQGFRNQEDYFAWLNRPDDLPSNPRQVYKSLWTGWDYWLGKGPAKSPKGQGRTAFLPFENARTFARNIAAEFGIQTQGAWFVWAKSDARPLQIPVDPYKAYFGKGWISWPDWFGREPARASGHESIKTFSEARDYARALGVKSSEEWYKWAASQQRPDDIPYSPDTRYRNDGWIGWGDFLGIRGRWTHHAVVAYLESLKPVIEHLSEFDLYLILSRCGMLTADFRHGKSKALRGLMRCRTAADIDELKDDIANSVLREIAGQSKGGRRTAKATNTVGDSRLRPLLILDDMKAVDQLAEARITDDPEVLEFMVHERVAALWNKAIEEGEATALATIPAGNGPYLCQIRDCFGEELDAVKALPIPRDWSFRDALERPYQPNLMQRLTAFRLLRDRRLGNWSGVGAGKTIAALLSAAILDAKVTVIIAANATRQEWGKVIGNVFGENAHVYLDHPTQFHARSDKRSFLIVNYETFQQDWSERFVRELTHENRVDFVVLDEVQFARRRFPGKPTNRRKNVESLIAEVLASNSDARILAMSATPVVNNLREAVNVLKLLHPEKDFSRIPVGTSIPNAAQVHLLLKRYGIRWVPDYDGIYGLKKTKQTPQLDGHRILDRLLDVPAKDILRIEQALLDVKLEHLPQWLRRGTMIYTHYVQGIAAKLEQRVRSCGLRPRMFIGRSQVRIPDFIEEMKRNEADVLIGSSPIGTGVDGLQRYLDRLIFISLPWSDAEYQQIVGRLYRQGRDANAGPVEVIIPIVNLRQERIGNWSWDDLRFQLIENKASLANAAIDGAIPIDGFTTKHHMQQQSLTALRIWCDRVRKGMSGLALS